MRLLVVSHKPSWRSGAHVLTDGGFPMQMHAIAELFEETVVCVPVGESPPPEGAARIDGPGVRVVGLPAPQGTGVWRKVLFAIWTLRASKTLIGELRKADAIHVPIPGDVGTLGILLAELSRKPLFVRHCGNWANERTVAERVWKRYMTRVGGGRRVMFATGGGELGPSPGRDVEWIFSTSLREAELRAAGRVRSLAPGRPLRLVTAGRQVEAKGTGAVLEAVAQLVEQHPGIHLDVLGDGPDLPRFRAMAASLGIEDSVRFHGYVGHDDVMAMLASADLFVFPTRSSEGFPKVVGEALAAGVPVLTTPVSVLPYLLSHGGGVIVDSPDPGLVADAIRYLVAEPSRYRACSEAALQTASTLTLENWQQVLGQRLTERWGPLGGPSAPRARS